MAKTFWGKAAEGLFIGVTATAALPVALAKGAADFVSSGGDKDAFKKGANGVLNTIDVTMTKGMHAARDFGDRNADNIEKTIINTAAIAGGLVAKDKYFNHKKDNDKS